MWVGRSGYPVPVEELADDQHGAGSQHTLDFAARAAYQQAIDTGHPDIAPHAAFNLERLEEGPH